MGITPWGSRWWPTWSWNSTSGCEVFPLWQQTLFVWLLLLVERLLHLWLLGATGQPTPTLVYWAPTFVSALLWPWVFVVLRDLGRRAGAL